MNLTEKPQLVTWPVTHYVFIEKHGPFQESAGKAWGEAHALRAELASANEITGYFSLYKMKPTMIYRAGFSIASEPKSLPAGFTYEKFAGGKYSRFTYTGTYANLGPVSGRVMMLAAEQKIEVSDGFYIENYVNNPSTTAEENLITEILIPTK